VLQLQARLCSVSLRQVARWHQADYAAIVRLEKRAMSIGTILLIILILILIGVIPTWPYSRGWGYAPGGIVGLILIIILILLLLGRI
jgi:hypothetical protein